MTTPDLTTPDETPSDHLGKRYQRLVRKSKIHRRQLREAHRALAEQRESLHRAWSSASTTRMVLQDRVASLEYQLEQAKVQPYFWRARWFLLGSVFGILLTYFTVIR